MFNLNKETGFREQFSRRIQNILSRIGELEF